MVVDLSFHLAAFDFLCVCGMSEIGFGIALCNFKQFFSLQITNFLGHASRVKKLVPVISLSLSTSFLCPPPHVQIFNSQFTLSCLCLWPFFSSFGLGYFALTSHDNTIMIILHTESKSVMGDMCEGERKRIGLALINFKLWQKNSNCVLREIECSIQLCKIDMVILLY